MSKLLTIETPLDDYELLDFGGGRKLERFADVVVERPEPRALGATACQNWQPHWIFAGGPSAGGQWLPGQEGAPERWRATIDGLAFELSLKADGELGCRPEQVASWRWLRQTLLQCARRGTRVLNLFAGPGGATSAALQAGAEVTHVAVTEAFMEAARSSLGEQERVSWVYEDAAAYVAQACSRRERWDLIILDPPKFMLTPHGCVWDMQRDFARLVRQLAGLLGRDGLGLWISLHTSEIALDSVARLVSEAFPAHDVEAREVGVGTRDGRVMPGGSAVSWLNVDAGAHVGPRPALTAAQIEQRLDAYLDTVLSSRRTAAQPAQRLAALERPQQEFVLDWVESAAHSNAEMAYQFSNLAARALELMDARTAEEWLLRAMDVYDREGLYAGVAILQEVEAFAAQAGERDSALAFEDVAAVLGLFINGLSGRALKLQSGEHHFTDTETLHLPAMVTCFASREDNFRLYKAHAVYLWAQIRFGTFRATYTQDCEPRLRLAEGLVDYPDRDQALAFLQALERIRLDACLARELPGTHREMSQLLSRIGQSVVPAGWEIHAGRLQRPEASLQDSFEILPALYGCEEVPDLLLFQGTLMPDRAEAVMRQRVQRERELLRRMLVELAEDAELPSEEPDGSSHAKRFTLSMPTDNDLPDGFVFEVLLDGAPVSVPIEVREVIGSIMLDLGNIPPEFLQAAGAGGYSMTPGAEQRSADDVWKGTYHEDGAFLYNEWDFKRNHHRKNWCVLRELDVAPQDTSFRDKTLRKYSGLVKELRRTFEALRGEDKLLKKQKEGDDVDIDALVEAIADVRSGMEMTDRLFTKMHKLERNIAVMFMVDMSGSTKGWINDAERESLILLCEALETLGDRYAIYGFSGMTRKKCELFRVKRFDEPYDDAVVKRICGIKPQDYTRMGVTIRHLTKLLAEVEARTKLLITLSDGKPDDFDGYRGEYGIEDTRQALIEAKQQGIHPFCITIDDEARDYLPHMYGAVNYTVVDDVYKLPLKVSDIYRRLTT